MSVLGEKKRGKRIGFLVDRLGNDQLTYRLVSNLNAALRDGTLDDATVFCSEQGRPCLRPEFATMHWAEAWGDRSRLVATSVSSAMALKKMPGAARKSFYVWSLEWMGSCVPFADLRAAYGCPWMPLVARGDSHARLLSSCWNRPVTVSEEFDIAAFMEEK